MLITFVLRSKLFLLSLLKTTVSGSTSLSGPGVSRLEPQVLGREFPVCVEHRERCPSVVVIGVGGNCDLQVRAVADRQGGRVGTAAPPVGTLVTTE